METIVRKIVQLVEGRKITKDEAKELFRDFQSHLRKDTQEQDIAVIGIAGKFPEAENLSEFWENLLQGRRCLGAFSKNRRRDTDEILKSYFGQEIDDPEKMYRQGGFLKQIDKFDHRFFGISSREAVMIEPSHRLFLEIAWEAIADAGLGERLVGSNTGVFVGKDHFVGDIYKKLIPDPDILAATGSWPGILASRLAYIFDFRGPNMVVDTTCSSGLVAVHQACQAIKNKECDHAIAGGVSVEIVPAQGSQLGMTGSPDGIIRSFDKAANGTVWGEGVGAVLLKSAKKALAEGDPIHAIIKSSAILNGGTSKGLTTPKAEVQEEVILQAWQKSQINPETISYVEAHGTGTVLGDPIEFKALTNAFRHYTDKKQFCGIGSCKTNIGHLIGASGLAALIKVILSLKHKIIPASLNFQEPNPYINFSNSPLYVVDRLQEWHGKGYPRRAGISLFGLSGTNCHLVIEEAPPGKNFFSEMQPQLLTISAQSKEVLAEFIKSYHHWVDEHPKMNLADFCYTLNTGRRHFPHRLALIVQDWQELQVKLQYIQDFGLKGDLAQNIYYAEHRIVNSIRKDRPPGEMTKAEQQELNREAADYIKELKDRGYNRKEVAMIYVEGAEINWDELYKGQKHQRLHLPTYPFARVRHWVQSEVPLTLKESSEGDAFYTVVEERLASIWQDILGINSIDREDNFFELGGHSLRATQLNVRIANEFGSQLTLEEIFNYPSLKDLAEQIELAEKDLSHGRGSKRSMLACQEIAAVEEADYYELSYAQKRLWYLAELKPNSSAYHLPGQIILKERVDLRQIATVLDYLILRHESLRTYFTLVQGQVVQKIVEQVDFKLVEIDLSNLLESQKVAQRDQLFSQEFNKPFDLRIAPLFRAILVKMAEEHYELIFTQHHIISDGWSTEILRQEFAFLYKAVKAGQKVELPPLDIHYKDFASWQNQLFEDPAAIGQAKDFWLEQLSALRPLQLPRDYLSVTDDRPSRAYRLVIPLEVQQSLERLALQSATSLFTILLASFKLFLAQLCNQSSVQIGIPIAGRDHKALQNVVGFFVNTTIAAIKINPDEPFRGLVERVKEQMLMMLTYQSFPLELIVDELQIKYPEISVFFNLLNMGQRGEGFLQKIESYHLASVSEVKFPLTCYLQEYRNGIELRCHYLSSFFNPETIEVLFQRYQEILTEVAMDPDQIVANYGQVSKQRKLF